MRPWIKCIAYLLWVVGLILLSWVAYRYSVHLKQSSEANFSMAPTAWYQFIAPFLFGVYFSILFIRSWNMRPNMPMLLCICLPTFLLSIWFPLVVTSLPRNGYSPIPFPAWAEYTSMFYIPQFISGFTLIYGLMISKSRTDSMSTKL